MSDRGEIAQRARSPTADAGIPPRQGEHTPEPLPQRLVPEGGEPIQEAAEQGREEPPDFMASAYDVAREALIEGGIVDSDEQAADHLLARWMGKARRPVRRVPVARKADDDVLLERSRPAQPPAAIPSSPTLSTASLPRRDTTSKSKSKSLPAIPRDKAPPEDFMRPVSEFALSRLRQKGYIELFYFTEEGMRLAAGDTTPVHDDAFTVANRDATIVLSTGPRPLKGVKSDELLSWDQVSKARTLLLLHAQNEKWDQEHIEVLSLFFFRLDAHPIRSEPRGNETVVRYQARYRQEWHRAMTNDEPFNLAIINENALLRIQNQLMAEQTVRALQAVCNVILEPR
ncbi:hypothetical protein C2E23DRAFT_821311 [Lenzites betulinus]|nr:hypothetical protein C2E23DRAFT_821311 [Lenzites betulinus]